MNERQSIEGAGDLSNPTQRLVILNLGTRSIVVGAKPSADGGAHWLTDAELKGSAVDFHDLDLAALLSAFDAVLGVPAAADAQSTPASDPRPLTVLILHNQAISARIRVALLGAFGVRLGELGVENWALHVIGPPQEENRTVDGPKLGLAG